MVTHDTFWVNFILSWQHKVEQIKHAQIIDGL